MQTVSERSGECKLAMTVCTIPGKFPNMFRILLRQGWTYLADRNEEKVLLWKASC